MTDADNRPAVADHVERPARPRALVYALQAPSGVLVPETVTHNKRAAWVNAFNYLYKIDRNFAKRYWKDWDASQRAARKRGWRVVRAELLAAA